MIEAIAILIFFVFIFSGILTMVTRKTGTQKQDSPEVRAFCYWLKLYYYMIRSDRHE